VNFERDVLCVFKGARFSCSLSQADIKYDRERKQERTPRHDSSGAKNSVTKDIL
jgi:hypothetical protein